jgi:hypothetical protein
MADISISPVAPREFRVQVREGDRETTHQVTVPDRLGEGLELRDDDLERVLRESFRFLLAQRHLPLLPRVPKRTRTPPLLSRHVARGFRLIDGSSFPGSQR